MQTICDSQEARGSHSDAGRVMHNSFFASVSEFLPFYPYRFSNRSDWFPEMKNPIPRAKCKCLLQSTQQGGRTIDRSNVMDRRLLSQVLAAPLSIEVPPMRVSCSEGSDLTCTAQDRSPPHTCHGGQRSRTMGT